MFTLPELPYAYNALEPYIDERTMMIHHDKHHAAYIKNCNDAIAAFEQYATISIEDLLKKLNEVPDAIRTKVKNNGGGHFNHSFFWQSMAPNTNQEPRTPNGKLKTVIEKTFGSFEKFKELFSTAGLNRLGSGWVWLTTDGNTLTIIDTPNQDSPISDGVTPLLCIDVWEHAYYLKYQNLRGEYIKNWWNVVHWGEVERRFSQT